MSPTSEFSRKLKIILPVSFVALAGLWYAFRPELLFINHTVAESLPMDAKANPPAKVAQGMFHSVAHETMGDASIYRATDGKQCLRLTNFRTSNGPDVVVYLVAADDARDDATVKGADPINLGSMKGNVGDQNYELPGNIDLAKYR